MLCYLATADDDFGSAAAKETACWFEHQNTERLERDGLWTAQEPLSDGQQRGGWWFAMVLGVFGLPMVLEWYATKWSLLKSGHPLFPNPVPAANIHNPAHRPVAPSENQPHAGTGASTAPHMPVFGAQQTVLGLPTDAPWSSQNPQHIAIPTPHVYPPSSQPQQQPATATWAHQRHPRHPAALPVTGVNALAVPETYDLL
ncbi:hypothetical protein BKA62DRAFT_714034 [Auriculariales sp. MPI-PUGE-AT-0066]|nr:hypothetical protein BKA62DRAFT_714034 [Auriculariales sp. MPI-PUGE-AT-0066]